MKKFIAYSCFLSLSLALQALEFNFTNKVQDTVTISFMVDSKAPYALRNQNAVLNPRQTKPVGVGNTYMGRIFPMLGMVASSSKYGTAQYTIPADQLNKNLNIVIFKDKTTTLINTGPITTEKLFFDVRTR